MAPLLDQVRNMMARRPGAGPRCIACGRRIAPRDPQTRLRGGVQMHRRCATYDVQR